MAAAAASTNNQSAGGHGGSIFLLRKRERCESYLLFPGEASLGDGFWAFLYLLALGYCFVGLSSITARFFQSMENVVKHSRKVAVIDPLTNAWSFRYTIADISLLAFGTSFPQISLATIDAIRNIWQPLC